MMSQRSKRELSEEISPRYLKAKKAEKKQILDEFIATTGYHRKYAIRLLKHGRPRRSNKKHGLPKVYQGEVVVALEQIWEICGRICSKRLPPAGDGEGAGALRRIATACGNQKAFIEDELCHHRPLPRSSSL